MVSINHPVYGLIQAETTDEALILIQAFSAVSNSTRGSIRSGSAHDLWNKAGEDKKATIVRAYVTDSVKNGTLSRFTASFLRDAKPAGVMFRDWLASGTIPLSDAEIVKLASDSIARVGFNSSSVSSAVRAYNQSARATVVKLAEPVKLAAKKA